MCLLSVFMYSQQQFRPCDTHYLKLCERLQMLGSKPAIMSIRVNKLLKARSSFLSLLQFVQNNREWFSPTRVFASGTATDFDLPKASCVGALPAPSAPGSPKCLGDEFKELTTHLRPDHRASAEVRIPAADIRVGLVKSAADAHPGPEKAVGPRSNSGPTISIRGPKPEQAESRVAGTL